MIRLIPDYEDRRHCCLNASREAEVFQLISLLGTTPGVQINFQAITGLQAIKIDDFMLKCRSRGKRRHRSSQNRSDTHATSRYTPKPCKRFETKLHPQLNPPIFIYR